MYELILESSQTVTVVTALVKEDDGREAKVTLPQAYCICLPRDTMLWAHIVFT
jgi:hypothetical protein